MKYKIFGDTAVVRPEIGEDIGEQLILLAKKEGITLGSVTGIGAVDDVTVGVFDLEKKDYNHYRFTGNREITSLVGNITEMNGEPYVHLHITCAAQGGEVVGGHLLHSRISMTGEIFVKIIVGKVDREREENLRINLLKL